MEWYYVLCFRGKTTDHFADEMCNVTRLQRFYNFLHGVVVEEGFEGLFYK